MTTPPTYPVFLEIGSKRSYAGAIDWPGWYGAGRDEERALQGLLRYGPRYARAIQSAGLCFEPADTVAHFRVVERLPGNATTDFGAPDVAPTADQQPLDEAGLQRSLALLAACWDALAATQQAAIGQELRKGPRGGGRQLEEIIAHVVNAHASYLRRINWKPKLNTEVGAATVLRDAQNATHEALSTAVQIGLPAQGPRGGAIWRPRTFVRRAAWHILDHVWEIEDRADLAAGQ